MRFTIRCIDEHGLSCLEGHWAEIVVVGIHHQGLGLVASDDIRLRDKSLWHVVEEFQIVEAVRIGLRHIDGIDGVGVMLST